MSLIVKNPDISRFKQIKGWCFEFRHHKEEFKKFWRRFNINNSKKKTLRTHRTGK